MTISLAVPVDSLKKVRTESYTDCVLWSTLPSEAGRPPWQTCQPRFQGPSQFSRLTDNGEPPEGMVLADYGQYEEQWGVLTACGRYRPFQRRPAVALATGQHLEIDTAELERKDRLCICLPARSILAFLPKSLPGNSPPDRRRPSTRVFGRRHQAGAMAGFQ